MGTLYNRLLSRDSILYDWLNNMSTFYKNRIITNLLQLAPYIF